MNFIDRLQTASRANNSCLCIGLDPNPELMPEIDVFQFNREIIDATSDLVCAYKPNLAFYETLGIDGLRALEKTLAYISHKVPVIGDAKRGDIGSTSQAYAKALFETFGFDAVTVNPYLGHDSVAPFTDYTDKGVFILCKTSNPGAADFQETLSRGKSADADSRALYELVAVKALEWNVNGNIGLVVGATYPQQLKRIRNICPDMPLLIPGIGTQGGDIASVVEHSAGSKKAMFIINSSRQILYASRGKDFASAARKEALKLRDQINEYRGI